MKGALRIPGPRPVQQGGKLSQQGAGSRALGYCAGVFGMTTLTLLLACTVGKEPAPERHHPEGFGLPDSHGPAAKAQEDTCVACHGEDLAGGTAEVSCDTCHVAGWRTDCTFCHGGTAEPSGAPPRDISGATTAISFEPHTTHVTTNIHAAYDCVQCHIRPADALSPGHVFLGDTSPGVSEVDFTGGHSSAASYAGAAGCSNLYCHGNGQTAEGTATTGQDFSSCDSCHASDSSDQVAWAGMSGDHLRHLDEGLPCWECHQGTLGEDGGIKDPALHVNGVVDVALPASMERLDNGQCQGSCHSEGHGGRTW